MTQKVSVDGSEPNFLEIVNSHLLQIMIIILSNGPTAFTLVTENELLRKIDDALP